MRTSALEHRRRRETAVSCNSRKQRHLFVIRTLVGNLLWALGIVLVEIVLLSSFPLAALALQAIEICVHLVKVGFTDFPHFLRKLTVCDGSFRDGFTLKRTKFIAKGGIFELNLLIPPEIDGLLLCKEFRVRSVWLTQGFNLSGYLIKAVVEKSGATRLVKKYRRMG